MSKTENISCDAVSGSTSRSDSQESLKLEDFEKMVQVDCTLFYKGDRAQHLRREVQDELPNSMNLSDVIKTMAAKSATLKRENEVIGHLYLVTKTPSQKHYSQLDFEVFENKQLCHLGHGDVRLVYDTCGHLHSKKLLKSTESGKWTIERSGRSTMTSSMIGTVEDQLRDEQNIKDKTILLLSEALVRKDKRIESLEEVIRGMKEQMKITLPSVPELPSSATPTSTPAPPIYNSHFTGNPTMPFGQPVSSHGDRQTTGTSDTPPPSAAHTSSTIGSSAKAPPPSEGSDAASLVKRDIEARLKELEKDSANQEGEIEDMKEQMEKLLTDARRPRTTVVYNLNMSNCNTGILIIDSKSCKIYNKKMEASSTRRPAVPATIREDNTTSATSPTEDDDEDELFDVETGKKSAPFGKDSHRCGGVDRRNNIIINNAGNIGTQIGAIEYCTLYTTEPMDTDFSDGDLVRRGPRSNYVEPEYVPEYYVEPTLRNYRRSFFDGSN